MPIQWENIVPIIIAAIGVIGGSYWMKGRKVTDAEAADRLSQAAARNAEWDSRRIENLLKENDELRERIRELERPDKE